MEIAVVIIIIAVAAIFTVLKLRKILSGRESSCACTSCPFADDNEKCSASKKTCVNFDLPESKDANDKKPLHRNG